MYDRNSKGSMAYLALAGEILRLEKQQQQQQQSTATAKAQ
jgi:hypothetical protein